MKKVFLVFGSDFKDKHIVKELLEQKTRKPNDNNNHRVLRGGSFLCNDSYCSGYRVSRRMRSSPDTGLSHTGFRCVKDIK